MDLLDEKQLALCTPEELQVYQKLLRRDIALQSPLAYAEEVTAGTERYPHAEYVDRHLVALVEHRLFKSGISDTPGIRNLETGEFEHPSTGETACKFLALSEPPRHGKSFLVSDHLPPWFLTRWPDRNVILTTYEANFSKSWGRKGRDHMEEHADLFGVIPDKSSRAADEWTLEGHGGSMKTAGAGGAIMGKGAHLLIIDDPVKNAEEAMSAHKRGALKDWFISTVESRIEPGGVLILMATRWHEDDLHGNFAKEDDPLWYSINLPAIAGPDDPLGRTEGEALCPARYTVAQLEAKRDVGDDEDPDAPQGRYWFNALYQGEPKVEGGGIIKEPFRYYRNESGHHVWTEDGQILRVKPEDCLRFGTLDLAASVKTAADWTVFGVWDVSPLPTRRLFLVDRQLLRMESPDHAEKLQEWYELYPDIRFVGIENATYGTALIQKMGRTRTVPVRPLTADKDKITRAIPYGEGIRNGFVLFPQDASWLPEWEKEHTAFPNARHDDQVDVGAYAYIEFDKMPKRQRSTPREAANIQELAAQRLKELDAGGKKTAGRPLQPRRTGNRLTVRRRPSLL